MNLKLIIFVVVALLIGGVVGYYFGYDIGFERAANTPNNIAQIDNFAECIAAGNPVMESYPRKCSAGRLTFTEDIGNELLKMDLIKIDNPRPNQTISSPLEITGEARGTWYFEANFPIYLYDDKGRQIAQGFAEAKSDWMAEDFVVYEATLNFDAPNIQKGTLVLEKANPSGIPENEDALRLPVNFR